MSTNHNLFEEKGEPKWNRAEASSAYLPNALPLGQTGYLQASLLSDFNRPSATLEKTHRRRKKKRQLIMQKRSSRGFSVLTLQKKIESGAQFLTEREGEFQTTGAMCPKAGPQQAYSGFWRDQPALAKWNRAAAQLTSSVYYLLWLIHYTEMYLSADAVRPTGNPIQSWLFLCYQDWRQTGSWTD